MKSEFKSFPAKILLFGEYLVLNGERALAMPIGNFSGQLELLDEFHEDNISPFIQYLGALPNIFLDQDLIESVALEKLIFNSNIPIGYGAGSSGALTAAVYDAFVLRHDGELQDALATMEDFFHGSSSGLDPFISYTGEPTGEIHHQVMEHFYLLDSGVSRSTGPLVEIFKQMENDFSDLADFNASAITAMSTYDFPLLKKSLEKISLFQFQHFQEMIPKPYELIWKEIMGDSLLNIKLCGAGGGGFFLMFSNDADYIEKWALGRGLDIIKIQTLT